MTTHSNTYRSLWQSLTPLYDEPEARAITALVLDSAFGLSLTDLVCGKADHLMGDDRQRLQTLFARLQTGEPVQYVLGVAEFCGRQYAVSGATLIPRPETAELCSLITAHCGNDPQGIDNMAGDEPLRILDIGTGSGCIATTLALDVSGSSVEAWDISPAALAVAQGNAQRLGAQVLFRQQDALQLASDGKASDGKRDSADSLNKAAGYNSADGPLSVRWDIIVSNPPYICRKEQAAMHPNVLRHEPHAALFVPDDDPLLFYRHITAYAARTLTASGRLYFELNPLYAQSTAAMVAQAGLTPRLVNDSYGKQRFLIAQRSIG